MADSQRKYMNRVSDYQGVYWRIFWAWKQVVGCPLQSTKGAPSSSGRRRNNKIALRRAGFFGHGPVAAAPTLAVLIILVSGIVLCTSCPVLECPVTLIVSSPPLWQSPVRS